MATLTITVTNPGEAGAQYRRLAKAIEQAAAGMPDRVSSGASNVLTLDNGTGLCTVQVTAGPYQSALIKV